MLEALQHKAAQLEQDARNLVEQARLARGTQDIPVTRERRATPVGSLPIQATVVDKVEEQRSALYVACEAALEDKPHTFRDLCARLEIGRDDENSLKSVIVRLQRSGRPVVNLGNGSRAIWWIDEHDRCGQIAAGRRVVSARK